MVSEAFTKYFNELYADNPEYPSWILQDLRKDSVNKRVYASTISSVANFDKAISKLKVKTSGGDDEVRRDAPGHVCQVATEVGYFIF